MIRTNSFEWLFELFFYHIINLRYGLIAKKFFLYVGSLQKNAKIHNKLAVIKKKNVTLQIESFLKRNKYVSTVFI